jgi:ferric-dicitrate binding protein FerR (iron transport regulator)
MRKALRRVLAGRGTAAEEADVRAWLAEDPEGAALLARLDTAQQALGGERRSAVNTDTLLVRLRARRRPAAAGYRIAAIAATLVVGVGISLFMRRLSAPPVAFSTRDYVAPRGHRLALSLGDGSSITLAPGSRLTVAAGGAGAHHRAVTLDGEAYFAVAHDARRPFTVRTAWGIARDVGTVFDVRAFGDDSAMRVTVAEGRVAIAPLGRRMGTAPVLAAATAAVVDRSGRIVVQTAADVAGALVWLQGGLAFDKAPLPHVVSALERAFDIQITVADSALDGEALTATFGDEPVDNILDAVTLSIGAEYKRVGRMVTIRRRAHSAARPGTDAQFTARTLRQAHE